VQREILLLGNHHLLNSPAPRKKILQKNQGAGIGNPDNRAEEKTRITEKSL